jgi:hypothetical protein
MRGVLGMADSASGRSALEQCAVISGDLEIYGNAALTNVDELS